MTRRGRAYTKLYALVALLAALCVSSSAFAACTSPVGAAGDIVYSSTSTLMAYCNGTNWISMGQNAVVSYGTLTTGDICSATSGTAIACTGTLSGDVTSSGGTATVTTVAAINGATLGATTATSGNLLIGSGSQWVTHAVSGDITINSTGVTAIGANKVTMGDIAQIAGLSVVGVTGSSTANVAAITGTANQTLIVNSGGTALAFGALNLASGSAVTGALGLGNGGTGQITAAAARGSSGLNIDEMTTHGDSTYSIVATDRTVATSVALTAARTWTLPAASAVNAGQMVCVVDQAGGVTSSNTLTVSRAGSDKIDGANSYVIKTAYGSVCLASDGSANWSAVGGGGGSPGGSTTQVQYNNAGAFAGDANFTYGGSGALTLGVATSQTGTLLLAGGTSGTATITPQATAGTPTLTLPNASGTFAVSASAPLSLSATTGALTLGTVGVGSGGTGTATTFTTGSIVFAGASGVYSQDNAKFFWDDTNFRLGINTATPTKDLSFGGTAARQIWMERAASGGGQSLTVGAGGAQSATSDLTGGNLILSSGISTGTNSSNVQVVVYPAAASTSSSDNTATTALTISETGTVTGGTGSFGNLNTALQTTAASGTDKNGSNLILSSGVSTGTGSSNINFNVAAAGSTGSTAHAATTAMTIASSGNVGIGTATPSDPLEIYANTNSSQGIVIQNVNAGSSAYIRAMLVNNSGTPAGMLYGSSANTGYAGANGLAVGIFNSSSGNLEFFTNNSTAMTINSSGNVGIGATAPLFKLEVVGADAAVDAGNGETGIFAVSLGTGINSDSKIEFGVHDVGGAPPGNYGWIQAINSSAGFRNLVLEGSAGNVGIGTVTPNPLGVAAYGPALDVVGSTSGNRPVLELWQNAALTSGQATGQINFLSGTGPAAGAAILSKATGTTGGTGDLEFWTSATSGGITSPDMVISPTGSIGIATTTPQSLLHVYGGEVQVGSSGASCAAANAGAVRFSGTTLSFCNGTTWTASNAGGAAGAGGSTTQVQYNSSGALAGDSSFVYTTPGALALGKSGTLGSLAFGNATSGTVTIQPVAGALGAVTLSLPAATDTLVGRATTDTLTNKTYDSAGTGNVLKISGTTVSGLQGSGGSLVMATSPTLTTPVLGVATATSINGLTITSSTGTLTITNGKTLAASNSLTLAGTDGTTMTFPGASDTVGGLGTAQTWTAANTHNVARTVASGAAATLDDIGVTAATTTITGTTTIATAKGFNKVSLYQPTYTDGSTVTVSNAATLYIDNAPAQAGSVTITSPWAIWVGAGNVKFPGTGNVLGTITSGTWNGSQIDVAHGGTNATSFTTNGVLYGNSTSAIQVTGQGGANTILTANSGAPAWSASPTVGTSVTTPLVIGGTGASSTLKLESTSGTGTTDAIQFATGSQAVAMTIGSNGNVAIGASGQAYTFYVSGTTRLQGNAIVIGTFGAIGIPNSAGDSYVCNNTGTGFMSWNGAGCDISDERLKKNIQTLENPLDKIAKLRGVTFEWKNETNAHHGTQIGFIAQEVEKVFPSVVATGSDGFKSVGYNKLVAPLVEGVKQLKVMFDSDHGEVIKLKAANDNQAKALDDLRAIVLKQKQDFEAYKKAHP